MARRPPKSKETVRDAILRSDGVMINVARVMKCDWNTAKKYVHKWPDLLDLFNEQGQKVTDLAENNVINEVKRGKEWATKFWLTTRGRDRGFGDRQEIEQIGEINVRVKIES